MSLLVARPVSHRSEVRTFALGLCAFVMSFSAIVAADAYVTSIDTPSIPLYPNATLVTPGHSSSETSPNHLQVVYTTSDKLEAVQRFYEQALWENGWTKSLCGYYQSRHQYLLHLRISPQVAGTTISISAQKGKIACDYTGGAAPPIVVGY
jgi:hypothetical protein